VKRLTIVAVLLLLLLLLTGVAAPPLTTSVSPAAFPFGRATVTPYVAGDGKGGFEVSWVDSKAKTFNVAHYDGVAWSKAKLIARGDMLENKADYPSIAVSGRNVFAQWRERAGAGRLIRLARSNDGGATWSAPVTPHPAMAREFGFVSMLPLTDGSARVLWLDGREKPTALRAATMNAAGTLSAQEVVDARVCDCCQTAAAMTPHGPVVVYRDRSDAEMRDIAIAPAVAHAHSALIHHDDWHLTGCPVNGPRIDARGAHAAVAWYTAAKEKPQVLVAFSRDGGATFGPPVRVDAGHPGGRVDVVQLADNSAIVTWVETATPAAKIMARRVTESGALDPMQTLGSSRAAVGFPRIALSNQSILAAWNGDDGIHLAILKTRIR
jgi:hypothetical protein